MKCAWTITHKDILEYQKKRSKSMHSARIRKYIREMAIAERAYYEGFKPGKEKLMFKEEIDDIEKVYEKVILGADNALEANLPSLLHCMQEFIDLHARKEAVSEKLAALRVKLGKDKPEEEDE